MALESIKAEIDLLLQAMVNEPEDAQELREQIREKLNEMRAMGMPVPENLLGLEAQLDRDMDDVGD